MVLLHIIKHRNPLQRANINHSTRAHSNSNFNYICANYFANNEAKRLGLSCGVGKALNMQIASSTALSKKETLPSQSDLYICEIVSRL